MIGKGSFGIVTTHYTALKEYAFNNEFIINASMEFDSTSFQPLYRVNIGNPGSSNALAIAKMLGCIYLIPLENMKKF